MSEINLQLPARILFGINETNRLGMELGKLGKRVLMITDKDREEEAIKIRHLLEGHGIGVILSTEESVKGNSFTIEDCQNLAQASHIDAILAYGSMSSIVTARAVACCTGKGHPDSLAKQGHIKEPSLPCFEVISDFWNPLFLNKLFYITNSRNGCSSLIYHSPPACNIQCCDPRQSLGLPERVRIPQYFDLLLHTASIAIPRKISFIGRENCHSAFKRLWKLRRSMAESWNLDMITSLMEAGLLTSMTQKDSGPTWVCLLIQAISGHSGISRNIIAMIMAPFILNFFNETLTGEFAAFIHSLEDLKAPPESPQNFIDTFRELIGWYAMPSQLRQTGIPVDSLALAAETAGQMLSATGDGGVTVDQMFELMESCW